MTDEQQLTRNQEIAIDHLIVPNLTIDEVASAADVSRRTIFRWMAENKVFQEAYKKAKRERFRVVVAKLQNLSHLAIDALREVMVDKNAPPMARVSAARTALEYAGKYTESDDIEHRVSELEKILNAKVVNANEQSQI